MFYNYIRFLYKCPMNGLCSLENVAYQEIIFPKENVKTTKTYIGISSRKWKLRFANHNHSFSYEQLKDQTALSKHFWKWKNKGFTPWNSIEYIEKTEYFKLLW